MNVLTFAFRPSKDQRRKRIRIDQRDQIQHSLYGSVKIVNKSKRIILESRSLKYLRRQEKCGRKLQINPNGRKKLPKKKKNTWKQCEEYKKSGGSAGAGDGTSEKAEGGKKRKKESPIKKNINAGTGTGNYKSKEYISDDDSSSESGAEKKKSKTSNDKAAKKKDKSDESGKESEEESSKGEESDEN